MSCDDNHEARAKDRAKRRSLPLADAATAPTQKVSAPKYWRSAAERDRKGPPVGAANEFAGGTFDVEAHVAAGSDGQGSAVSRRGFMQVASLSTAMAAVGAACAKPRQKIVPVRAPPRGGDAGERAALRDGVRPGRLRQRPARREPRGPSDEDRGQPGPPADAGRDDGVRAEPRAGPLRRQSREAAALGRSRRWPGGRSWPRWRCARAGCAENGGAGLRFLISPTTSPLLADLRRRVLERFPGAKFVSYSSLSDDGAVEGAKLAFGKPLVPRLKAAPANVILSLDADFLGEGNEQTRLSREFAARREPSRQMSRLYVVEPALTVTGVMADHRLRLQGGEVGGFLSSLISMLASRGLAALGPLAALTQRPAALGSEVAGRGRERPRAQPRQQPGRRGAPAAAGRSRAGGRAQRRARQPRQHRRLRRAADLRPDVGAGAAGRARGGDRVGRRRHPGDHGVEPGVRRARRLRSWASCSSACPTRSITGSTRTRRRPPARPWSPRRTRWSRGATCAPPTARCRSCSR